MSSQNRRLQSPLSQAIGVATGIGSVGGFISDIAYPLIPLSSLLAGFFMVSLILCLLVGALPILRSRLVSTFYWLPFRSQIQTFWQTPLLVFLVIMTISFSFASYFSKTTEDQGGFAVTIFPFLKGIQSSLGVLSEQGDLIQKNTFEIKNKMDDLKKETSEDPRKEIASFGLSWSEGDFLASINDEKISQLYFSGGMKAKGDSFFNYLFNEEPNEYAIKKIMEGHVFYEPACALSRFNMDSVTVLHLAGKFNKEKKALVRFMCRDEFSDLPGLINEKSISYDEAGERFLFYAKNNNLSKTEEYGLKQIYLKKDIDAMRVLVEIGK